MSIVIGKIYRALLFWFIPSFAIYATPKIRNPNIIILS